MSSAESFPRKAAIEHLVGGPDRADQNTHPALRFCMGLPLVGIGPYRQPRIRRRQIELARLNANAGIERNDAALIGEQRIDVELS